MRLKQKRAHHVVNGTNDALRFTVLRRGAWAWHTEMDAMGEEEGAGVEVVKLATIIALDVLDGGAKLRTYIGEEVSNCRERVRV